MHVEFDRPCRRGETFVALRTAIIRTSYSERAIINCLTFLGSLLKRWALPKLGCLCLVLLLLRYYYDRIAIEMQLDIGMNKKLLLREIRRVEYFGAYTRVKLLASRVRR